MAKRRKVANLMALAVLATVYQRPMHRYEIASVLRDRDKDQDMDLKMGSLYTVVQNMAKHGFLEAIGNTRQGARPERTVYRITEEGRHELTDWVRELVSTPQPEHPSFAAGLSVLAALPPQEVADLLETRLAALEESIARKRAALADETEQVPRLFLAEQEYGVAMAEAEARWVKSLHAELTSGTYPDLASWRAWHETGEVNPEWAALAERGATPE